MHNDVFRYRYRHQTNFTDIDMTKIIFDIEIRHKQFEISIFYLYKF